MSMEQAFFAVLVLFVGTIITDGVVTMLEMRKRNKAVKKKVAHEKRQEEKLQATRVRYGREFYNFVEAMITELGQKYERSDLVYNRLMENGGNYSIFAGLRREDFTTYGVPGIPGTCLVQVNVPRTGEDEQISVTWGHSPTERDIGHYPCTDADVQAAKGWIVNRLEAEIRDHG